MTFKRYYLHRSPNGVCGPYAVLDYPGYYQHMVDHELIVAEGSHKAMWAAWRLLTREPGDYA